MIVETDHSFYTNPAVTVVLPMFNAAATIDATIKSVLAQSFDHFELIVVDDGSTDDSLHRGMRYAQNDTRVRLISRANGGVSAARNLGASLGSAPLIAFIDADDLWDPSKLARHVEMHHEHPRLAASYARIAFIAQNAAELSSAQTLSSLCPHMPMLLDVLGDNPVCTTSNFVVRRDWFEMLEGFNEDLSFAEDQDLVARLVNSLGQLGGIDAVLTGYRFSPDGLSMDLDRMYAGWRAVALQFLTASQLRPLEALYCRYLARRVLRATGDPKQSFAFAMSGLRLDAATFLRDRRRGLGTLAAAFVAPLVPAPLRKHMFA
jgi:glycosyltransferase involved in cell wall biosynthesis